MADYVIKAEPEQIENTASKIENQMNTMNGLMNDMQQQVDLLQDYFISNAGTDYHSKYASVNRDINNSLTEIKAVITGLKAAAGILREHDQQASNDVGALNTQSVFTN